MATDERDGRRRRKQRRTGSGPRNRVPAGERQQSGSKAPRNTSWDPVASWYTGWAGQGGSIYHRRVALPTVMRLADPQRGERLLDVGAGHGVLARPVLKTGADYTGVIRDRKSTRLNSSHVAISYAVFCLKKKKTK